MSIYLVRCRECGGVARIDTTNRACSASLALGREEGYYRVEYNSGMTTYYGMCRRQGHIVELNVAVAPMTFEEFTGLNADDIMPIEEFDMRKWRADNEIPDTGDMERRSESDTLIQWTTQQDERVFDFARSMARVGALGDSPYFETVRRAQQQRARNIAIGIDPAATEQEYTSTIQGATISFTIVDELRETIQSLGIETISEGDDYTTGETEEPPEGFFDGQQLRWRDDDPTEQRSGSDKPRERADESPQLPAAKWDAGEYDYEQFANLLKEADRHEFIGLWDSVQSALDRFAYSANRGTLETSKENAALILARTVEAFNKLGIPVRTRNHE